MNLIHQMQCYLLGWVGLMLAFGGTFGSALWRVSQTPKFTGQAVKSQSCTGQELPNHQVVSWAAHCASGQRASEQSASEQSASPKN
jgi:hypothetical protein